MERNLNTEAHLETWTSSRFSGQDRAKFTGKQVNNLKQVKVGLKNMEEVRSNDLLVFSKTF